MKKLFFLLLLAFLSVTQAMAYDFEVGGIYYNVSGTNATVTFKDTNYNSYSGDKVIPETVTYGGVTYNVTSIDSQAFYRCTSLTSISIPESVTTINSSAFSGCSGLTSITIPESVTIIGSSAFCLCSGLTSITIPESVTSIGAKAFYGCSNLFVLSLPKTLQTIGDNAFANCTSLRSINIPESVTTIGKYILEGCSGLKELELPSWETYLGSVFGTKEFEGSYLQMIKFEHSSVGYYIPLELEKVTIARGVIASKAFEGCTSLKSVHFLAGVKEISANAMSNCTALEEVTMEEGVTTIANGAFSGCSALQNVTIPASVQTIETGAFPLVKTITMGANEVSDIPTTAGVNANALIYVKSKLLLPFRSATAWASYAQHIVPIDGTSMEVTVTANANASAVHMAIGEENLANIATLKVNGTINGYDLMIMHDKMPSLTSLDLSDATIVANPYVYHDEGGVKYSSENNILTGYAISPYLCNLKLPKNLVGIADKALYGNTNLRSIELYDGLESIGSYSFYNCSTLEELQLPESLTSIGEYAFQNCNSLIEMIIPDGVTSLGLHVLEDCNKLENLVMPFAEDILRYYLGMKNNVLKSFTIKRGPVPTYSSYGFFGINDPCKATIESVTFGDEITEFSGRGVCSYLRALKEIHFGPNVTYIGPEFFSGCSSLEHVDLPNALTEITSYMFGGCSSLKNVQLPSNVKTISANAFQNSGLESIEIPVNVKSLANGAFSGCKNLRSCTIPANAYLETIGNDVFKGCSALERIDLPVNVKSIGANAFQNCTALAEVRIPTAMSSIGNYAFDGCPNLNNVYTYTIEPQDIQYNTFSTYETATLYCPKVSYYNYYYATPWNRFLKLAEFDEPYEYVYIEKDFSILRDVVSGEPEFIVGNKGALIMESIVKQLAKIFHINMDAVTGIASSIISNGMIDALELEVSIDVKKDFWHFFCFPFDVDLTKVKKDGSWIFRQFDGHLRAENGAGNSWQDIEGTTLKAGKGYIFRTNTAGSLTLTIDNPKFDHESAKAVLEECTKTSGETENADKNWNFIGNLFTSYYDMNDLDYSSPIVVWDGTKYVAYRPGDDDDLVLTPFQAFFVQKPDGVANVGFDKDGRTTYLQSQENVEARSAARRKAAARLDSNRQLVNLTVSDGESVDKARVVFNEKQTMDYELGCDASKFISTENVPLIYSLDARGTRYAINERPMADGRVSLGFIAREDGTYTIAATRMDVPVLLIDNATGTTHDLNDGDYTFTADKGTYDKRFVLAVAEDYLAEGINAVNADEQGAAAKIYDLQGKRVERQQGVTIQNGKKVVSAM